jgi:uncharacterized DUF497 family protein
MAQIAAQLLSSRPAIGRLPAEKRSGSRTGRAGSSAFLPIGWRERVNCEPAAVSARVGRGQSGCRCAQALYPTIRDSFTVAGLEHSEIERWFSIGCARYGAMFPVVYLRTDADPEPAKIRLISARTATQTETRHYREGL